MAKIPKKVEEIRDYISRGVSVEADYKSISFSQLSLYVSCPYRWYRTYILKEAPYVPSIHTVFGTALHETMQEWLTILYGTSVKASEEFDSDQYLLDQMKKVYRKERDSLGRDFSTPKELASFYEDGVNIMSYVKKHRKEFFSSKNTYLVGCEIPILSKLQEKFYFKGFIDFLLYDEDLDRWKIYDIKTSTSGWNVETKKDFNKISQVLLYKAFLSKEFGIDQDRIDVEYFIVKRRVPENAEFPNLKRRVQEFEPSNGKVSVNRAMKAVTAFIEDTLDAEGNYKQEECTATPTPGSCKWCLFKDDCKYLQK